MKTITQDQYYQLVGIIAAHTEQQKLLKLLEQAAVAITEEKDSVGEPDYGGHTIDMLWGGRYLRDGLRIMEIEVTPPSSQEQL